jgi:1-deoxy-D-xylulose-5-phosphate synthase
VILAVGRMVEVAGVAADRLAADGVSCGVVNARWVKPVDPRLVADWGLRYPLLVTAEDNVGSGGFGAAVLEALAPHGLAGKVRVAALPDQFLPQGKQAEILAQHGLSPEGLADLVRKSLSSQGSGRRSAGTAGLPQLRPPTT